MKVNKNVKTIGLLILVIFSLSSVLNTNNVSAFWNWVEWKGTITYEEGNLSGATVKLKKGSITLDTYITEGNGYYEFKEYVSTTDYLTLHVSKTNYTSESVHVLARDIGEPWIYDFELIFVKTYAVIVGINDYAHDNITTLLYCENDADEWNGQLTNSTGLDFDYVKQYEDDAEGIIGKATESNVKSELIYVASNADGGDIIAFIFSGHGDNGPTGEEYSLCMEDADVGGEEDGFLNYTELANIFDGCKAERIFFFFDSCFSFGMDTGIATLSIKSHFFLAAAADINQIAYQDEGNDLSCWTYCFLKYSWGGSSERTPPGYDLSTTASFDSIFYTAYIAHNLFALLELPEYSTVTFPKRSNYYGEDFCLSR